MKVATLARSGKLRSNKLELFHGTSSVFLRQILLYGLDPSKVDKRVFDGEEERTSLGVFSIKTYGGIYLAERFNTALSFARGAKSKFGGNRLVVMVESHERLLPDEDSMRFGLREALIQSQFGNIGDLNYTLLLSPWLRFRLNTNYVNPYSHFKQKSIQQRVDDFLTSLTKYWDLQPLNAKARYKIFGLARAVLEAYFERGMAYEFANYKDRLYTLRQEIPYLLFNLLPRGSKLLDKYLHITYEDFDSTRIKSMRLKDPEQKLFQAISKQAAEHKFREASNRLMIALANKGFIQTENAAHRINKHESDDGDVTSNRTFRSLEPIRFAGRNRITGIIEYVQLPDTKEKPNPDSLMDRSVYNLNIVLHYGRFNDRFTKILDRMIKMESAYSRYNIIITDKKNRTNYLSVSEIPNSLVGK